MKKSSALCVNISIETEIILPCFLISDIVSILKKELYQIVLTVLSLMLEQIDDILLKEKPKNIIICRKVKRSVKTYFGEVFFKYRQAKAGEKYFSPLLELIGLERYSRITEDLLEQAVNICTKASFRNASKILESKLPTTSLWRYLQKRAVIYQKNIDDALYCFNEGDYSQVSNEKDFAIVMIDEIWIRGKKKKQWLKVKTARLNAARFQSDNTHHFEPVCVYATISSQETFLKKASDFFNAQKGLHKIKNIIVITDGCPMGKQFCKLYPQTSKGRVLMAV